MFYNCNKKYKTPEKFKSYMKDVHDMDIDEMDMEYIKNGEMIPTKMANKNAGPRHVYQCSENKQSLGLYSAENLYKYQNDSSHFKQAVEKFSEYDKNTIPAHSYSQSPNITSDKPKINPNYAYDQKIKELEDEIKKLKSENKKLKYEKCKSKYMGLEKNLDTVFLDEISKENKVDKQKYGLYKPIDGTIDKAIWNKIGVVSFESKFIDKVDETGTYIGIGKPTKGKAQKMEELLEVLYGDKVMDVILGKISPTEALDHTNLGKKLKEMYGDKFEDYVNGKISLEELEVIADKEILLKELFEDIISDKITNSEIIDKSQYKNEHKENNEYDVDDIIEDVDDIEITIDI